MAHVAPLYRPGNLSVVTHSTETPLYDRVHRDVIGTCAHLEAKLGMTNLAAKSYPMKPMRINHRPHAILFGRVIKDYVGVLCLSKACREEYEQGQEKPRHLATFSLGPTRFKPNRSSNARNSA